MWRNIGKCAIIELWQRYLPNNNSRIKEATHHAIFLATLVQYLVDKEGYTVEEAWDDVCRYSEKLGHYSNSENAIKTFEPTGSRKVGKWFDLNNTFKILKWSETSDFFVLAGGNFNICGESHPLADCSYIHDSEENLDNAVVQIVLDV